MRRSGSPSTGAERTRAAPRFIADAMLGSLARKLRIFGFDTLYFKEGEDADLERLAKQEERTILTADGSLYSHSRRRGLRVILVEGSTDRARMLSVTNQAGKEMAALAARPSMSRCAVCNVELEVVPRSEAARLKVPSKVLPRHRLFYRCKTCSRLYWRGRHWVRLRRLSYSLRTKTLT